MRQFLLGLSFSVVFIVGCAVGTMQGSQVAEAQAPAGAGWRFQCVVPRQADELAAEGWEPYAVATHKGVIEHCLRARQ